MEERKAPASLEEAYGLRDSARDPQERHLYQEHVHRLRRESYESQGVRMALSRQKREKAKKGGADRGQTSRVRGEEPAVDRAMRRLAVVLAAVAVTISLIGMLARAAGFA